MSAKRIRLGLLVASIALTTVPVLCQTAPGGTTGPGTIGGGTTGGTTGGTRTPTTRVPTQPTERQQPQIQRPIFLSGAVMMADGSPVPRGVEIIRVCSGRTRREAYTDSTGHFSFQVGQNAMVQDATTNDVADARFGPLGVNQSLNPMGNQSSGFGGGENLFGCELKAQIAGFRSTSIDLSTVRTFDNPDIGTLVLERYEKVQGTMASVTSMAAPKEAQKAFKKGKDLAKKGKWEEAEQKFTEATQLYPKYADAWFELGMVYQRGNQVDASKRAYEQALSADTKFVGPYIQLAALAAMSQDWSKTASFSEQAIKLDPIDFPGSYFFNSVAHFNMGHVEAAEEGARKAMKLDSQHRLPQIQLLLGRILMAKRDFPGAIEHLRGYLHYSPNAPDADTVRRQVETMLQASTAQPPGGSVPPKP